MIIILSSSIEKNFYDQTIDSDIKWLEEIIELTTGQVAYTTGCFLDYDYIKNHYILTAINLSKQKESDVDPKAIQQIEFVGKLKKKLDDDDGAESPFFNGFRKNLRNEIKIFQGIVKVLIDGVTETVKHEIKNKKVNFLEPC